jgi:hypothetical protein
MLTSLQQHSRWKFGQSDLILATVEAQILYTFVSNYVDCFSMQAEEKASRKTK